MLSYQMANDDQVGDFLDLMHSELADYIERTLTLMEMNWEQFCQLARKTGQVFCIFMDEALAGYYWIEGRNRILHLHGIVIAREYQGQGIGSEVLRMLQRKYAGSMVAIELGVHESNLKARWLYERSGFRVVRCLDDLGYDILQCPLNG